MNKAELTQKLSAVEFAMWDLHLYLDTHPGDLSAVGLYNKYYKQYRMLREEYESTCGKPFTYSITAFKSRTSVDTVISCVRPSLFEKIPPPLKSNVNAAYPSAAIVFAYFFKDF